MTIAALRTLVAQVPSWQDRLGKLVADIDARQTELSQAEKSTVQDSTTPTPDLNTHASSSHSIRGLQTDNMNIDSATSVASLQKPTQSVANGPTAKTKRPDPVYFDGNMQKFFEELVHFIAVSRNMMRKAKMAARIAQIKKMAEVQVGDDTGDDTPQRPTLHYVSARGLDSLASATPNGGPSTGREPDIFDALDKNLDTLQSTSELAAFQFLREASNNKHMKTINKILGDVLEAATAELARLARDEPALIRDADAAAARTKRPLSMRKELPAGSRPAEAPNKRQNLGHFNPSTSLSPIGHMEVDFAALRNDEAIAPQVIHMPTNVHV
ncbi:hypothetical protein BM221_003647 [Beauveria bassiana]|uniref:Uncharacterized protein n=1 Tax=Beauveria bassiana TaxID=176275 RepID=A0A2N6NV86_BEABA|nr:hypothetical protein BM221_003647 [Beauveria bassiana]